MESIAWPVRTIRTKTGDLYISVDSLRGLRNQMGAAGWHDALTQVLDSIIAEAQNADAYGRDVT